MFIVKKEENIMIISRKRLKELQNIPDGDFSQ
jgi:hypothetical protein